MPRFQRCSFFAILVAIVAAISTSIVSALPTNSAWFARVWRTENGLPDNNVAGLVQNKAGFLWVGTHNGLARFDGVKFEEFLLPLPSGRSHPLIRAMLLDREDRLWTAVEGGLAICISPTTTNVFTLQDGLPNFRPVNIVQGIDGAIWIGYVNGSACRIAEGVVTRYTAHEGLAGIGQCWLASDSKGQIWFAKSGHVGIFREGEFQTLTTFAESSVRISGSRKGGVWICAGKRLFKFDEVREPEMMGEIGFEQPGTEVTALLEDSYGGLWIGTSVSGLFHHGGGRIVKVETSHGDILCVTEDKEGNIWAGTGGGGMNRLRPRAIELQGREAGLPVDAVRSVCEDSSGTLWLVAQSGAVLRQEKDLWRNVAGSDGWAGSRATCITSDGEGGVWIGTYRGGLNHLKNGGSTTFRRRDGLAGEIVRSLMLDSTGTLWIGLETSTCVQSLKDGVFKTFRQPATSRAVRGIAEDSNHNIWLGTLSGYLLRVNGDMLVDETPKTVSPLKPIRSLSATSDGSVWIAYAGAGLGRMKDGKFMAFAQDQGVQDIQICAVVPDELGTLWLAGDHDILRIRLEEFDTVAAGRYRAVHSTVYGKDEALLNFQANYGYAPSTARSRDGRLFFTTQNGLAIVHPDLVHTNVIPPQVLIESLSVDGKQKKPETYQEFRLPPGHRKIEFVFTAPSFIAPEDMQFQYRLDGWDEQWVDAGNSRNAGYSRLPAGNYTFCIRARNGDGVWSEKEARLAITVQPFFWQTWWFGGSTFLVFTIAIVFVVRYVSFRRLRVKLRSLEKETALQNDRARIARDLHDDLGASLTHIALLSELAQKELAQPQQAEDHIDQIFRTARTAVRSLDEIVWVVNPKNDTLDRFAEYLCGYVPDFLKAAGIRCRLDMPVEVPMIPLPHDTGHHLYLAVKETLHNIIKHSGASEVWLRLQFSQEKLTLVIEDNGRGYAAGMKLQPDADGLANLRQRLASLGGECEQSSEPGKGTTTRFVMPVKHTPQIASQL